MAFSAKEIAKWFLVRNHSDVKEFGSESLTHLKLQKLLYYAQGVHLAFTEGNPLFEDELFAWDHGPVAPRVYELYKGSRDIEFEPLESDLDIFTRIQSNEIARNVLETVYGHYGKYSAWHLRNMTHEERPWVETPKNEVIPMELIQEFFEEEVLEE